MRRCGESSPAAGRQVQRRGRRLEAEAPIDAQTLKSVLINYLDGDTDWRDEVGLTASDSPGDRTRAAALLSTLTESRDAGVLEQMRERALPSIVEMARWNSLAYALPAYVLAGRLAGLTENEIQDTWSKGERETTLARIASPAKAGK